MSQIPIGMVLIPNTRFCSFPKIIKLLLFKYGWQRRAWQKKKRHNCWIKSRTKTKEEKDAYTKILIKIRKKNYKFYMKNAPLPLKNIS